MLAVPQLDLVLMPWPVPVSDTEYNRKERNRQAVTMRKTWSKLCTLFITFNMLFLFYETYDKIIMTAWKTANRETGGKVEPEPSPRGRSSHADIFHNGVSIIS